MNNESGPILLFDTRIEVKAKQGRMEIKEGNGSVDIDVSLLSPVVELKEESADSEDRNHQVKCQVSGWNHCHSSYKLLLRIMRVKPQPSSRRQVSNR